MHIFSKNSFAAKLFFSYLLLLFIPFTILFLALSISSYRNIKQNTLSYIDALSRQISTNADTYMGELDRMTKTNFLDSELCKILTENPDQLSAGEHYKHTQYMSNAILKMMTQQPGILTVIYHGSNGLTYTGNSTAVIDTDTFNSITLANQVTPSNRNIYISAAHIPDYLIPQSNELAFTVTRGLYSLDNNYIGTVVLVIRCSDFLDSINISPTMLQNGSRVLLTADSDAILADTSPNFTRELLIDSSEIFFTFDEKEETSEVYFTETSDFTGLTTTIMVDRGVLFQSTFDFLRTALLIVILLTVFILVLSYYFSRRLVTPLHQLNDAVQEYAKGNYDVMLPVRTSDEIGTLCSSFNYMAEQIHQLLTQVYQYQLVNKQAQLEALQNQIQPHFLHNTLEIIRMKALINQDREVAEMIKILARLFRIILDTNSNIVPIGTELEHTQVYLTIQNMRFNNRYQLQIKVEDNLEEYSIIKLCLQPLVENCIIHGFASKQKDARISIHIFEKQGDVFIHVEDNGIGISSDNLKRIHEQLAHKNQDTATKLRQSIGIVNISDRIRLEYGENYYLKISSPKEEGTLVELKIPKLKI